MILSTKSASSLNVGAGDRIDVAGRPVTVARVSGNDEFSHAP